MKNTIEQSIKIYATSAEIWGALTDSDQLEDWWSEEVTLEPKVGGKFREAWKDDSGQKQLAQGKVLEMKAQQSITFTWKEKEWPANLETTCSFKISDERSHRTLTVIHEGWDAFPDAKKNKVIQDFTLGWKYHLQELKAYLDD